MKTDELGMMKVGTNEVSLAIDDIYRDLRQSTTPAGVVVAILIWCAIGASASEPLRWQQARLPFPEDVTGQAVTIAHIADVVGAHPDLESNERRKVWYVDATTDGWTEAQFATAGGEIVTHDLAILTCMAGSGQFQGVAPDANLLIVKGHRLSAGSDDTTSAHTGDSAGLTRLIRWIVGRKEQYGIRMITVSLSTIDVHFDRMDPWEASPLCRAVEYATSKAILVIWGVGNQRYVSFQAPVNAPSILAIGGVTGAWRLPKQWELYHHTIGRTLRGTNLPHLLAPADTPCPLPLYGMDELTPSTRRPAGSPLEDFAGRFLFQTGTSFAGPYVAGVVALCLEVDPTLTPSDIRRILLQSANRLEYVPAQEQGAGLVDPVAAVELARGTMPIFLDAGAHDKFAPEALLPALMHDDAALRSRALLALCEEYTSLDRAFAETLLAALDTDYVETLCGVLAYLRRYPGLRDEVLERPLRSHPHVAVRFNWGRIAGAVDNAAGRDAVRELLRSPEPDLVQLGCYLARNIAGKSLQPSIKEAAKRFKDNRQIAYYARTAVRE